MSTEHALAQVRALFGRVNTDAVQLAARLLDAIEQARDLLAPLADEEAVPGPRVAEAFQLLADAAVDAAPPSPAPAGLTIPATRNGGAALLAGALALNP